MQHVTVPATGINKNYTWNDPRFNCGNNLSPRIPGEVMAACFQEVMRECTQWTKPEVELFAAMISKSNNCPYRLIVHADTASLGMDKPVVDTTSLESWRTAQISEQLGSALTFIEKLTKTPDKITSDDIQVLQKISISIKGIQEIAYIVFCFNTINGIANAFNFELARGYGQSINLRILYYMRYQSASLSG